MIMSRWISGGDDISDALAIRETVFVDEQGFSQALERDEKDDIAQHLILSEDGQPVGCARMFAERPGVIRVGRICILKPYRGQGYGDLIMRLLIDRALYLEAEEVRLGAQERVRGFYEKYGFIKIGDVYDEEGVPHIPMGAPSAILESLFASCGGGCEGCTKCGNGEGS